MYTIKKKIRITRRTTKTTKRTTKRTRTSNQMLHLEEAATKPYIGGG